MPKPLLYVAILLVVLPIKPTRAEETAVFPLPYFEDPLILPVTIGGKEHLFLLDSGASTNFFHTSLRDQLGEPKKKQLVSDADERDVEVEVFEAPLATVRTIPVARNAKVACHDLSMLRSITGHDIEGVLGMPFFATNVIQVNFDTRQLKILPASTQPEQEWGESIEVRFSESNLPFVMARVQSEDDETFLVDTGFSSSLGLRKDAFVSLSKVGAISSEPDSSFASLSSLSYSRRMGSLSKFKIAHWSHENLLVSEASENRIGLKYLRRYVVTFDLGQGRIFLLPAFDFASSEQKEKIGVSILRRDAATVITFVTRDSVAERAGIKENDELISLDGDDVAGKPIAEIIWLMRRLAQRGKGEVAVVRRQGRLETLTFNRD